MNLKEFLNVIERREMLQKECVYRDIHGVDSSISIRQFEDKDEKQKEESKKRYVIISERVLKENQIERC